MAIFRVGGKMIKNPECTKLENRGKRWPQMGFWVILKSGFLVGTKMRYHFRGPGFE